MVVVVSKRNILYAYVGGEVGMLIWKCWALALNFVSAQRM